jgi:hypothetical protein
MQKNTTTDAKRSKSVLVQTIGHEKLRISVTRSVMTGRRKLMSCFSEERESSKRKPSQVTYS